MPASLLGQKLLPPIYNYKVFEYNAGGQNWGLAVNDMGEVFAANDKGLLYYNGEEWNLNKLPNTTIVRSVASIGNRVYTGSYEEFGYWKKDGKGRLEYNSLTHLIKGHTFTNEDFWQITPYGNAVLFRSFSTLYVYENEKITVIDAKFIITNIAVYEDNVLVAAKNEGFYTFKNDSLLPYGDNRLLKDRTIIDMAPFQNGLLVGTQLNGCFFYQEGEFVPIDNTINNLLKQYQLNKILPLTSNVVAFGTIKNGIYLYDFKKKTSKNLNRGTGLQNNTVLALVQFEDQFWAGLEKGLDRIRISSPITYYTDYSGVLGTTHDLVAHKKNMYLGSNTGIYYFEDDEITFINGSQGHAWDLELIDGDLLAGHNSGTFRIDGGKMEKISDIAGGYHFVKAPEKPHVFLQGTYTGVAKYERTASKKWKITTLAGIDIPVKQLCFEDAQTLWTAHPYKGLFRFKLDEKLDSVIEKKKFGTNILPSIYQVKLYRIKNQIIIQSEGTWYKYDPILGEISVFEEFGTYNGKSLIYADGNHFWFIDNAQTKEIIYTDLRNTTISITEIQLNQRLVPDMEKTVKHNDSIFLLTLSDGFASMNLSELKRNLGDSAIPVPELTFFTDNNERYSVKDSVFDIPFKHSQDLRIQVAVPSMIKPRYHYEISGALARTEYMDHGTLNFQNLPHGEYRLDISTMSMDNKKSIPKTIQFKIAPPWHLSKWSMIGYFMVLIGMVFLVRLYNKQKLKRKHQTLKLRLQREQEEHLALLEKEKLEKEIKGKQNELARTTMSVAKKNELILELKDLMVLNKDAFPNKQRYRSLTKKLNSSINEDEDWKHFEVNFKELHDDFFDNLLQQFPKLTPKDLKLCAYLKMNLSSKEIAPLMAITLRGVEIHRYRLRKKLGIDSSQNLSNFLITFK